MFNKKQEWPCIRCKGERGWTLIESKYIQDCYLCDACFNHYQDRRELFLAEYIKEGEEFRDAIIAAIDSAITKCNEDLPDYDIRWDKKVTITKIYRNKE